MNIGYIADSNIPSRTANSIHVMKMCQAYARQGCNVQLVVPKWSNGSESNVQNVFSFYGVETEFPIKRIPFNWRSMNFLHRGLFLPLAASRPSPRFVHSRSVSAALGLMELFGIPTILEIHDVPHNTEKQLKVFHRVIGHKRFLGLVVITRALADRIRPLLNDPSIMMVLPDGVDRQSLDTNRSTDEARKLLGLQNETRRIAVYTGHLYAGRGIELIIHLAKNLTDHFFLVVGGQEKQLNEFREQTKDITNLRFEGFRPPSEIPIFLQSADVLLMPYGKYVEVRRGGKGADTSGHASPIKMFEYMAAGRPILSSDLPVLKEILTDGVNAMLLPSDDTDAWIGALKKLQADSSLCLSIGKRAKEDVAKYTWESRAQTLLDLSSQK